MYTITLPEISFLPIIIAAVLAFMVGGVWYHDKLFGNTYRAIFHQQQHPSRSMLPAMILQFIYNLLTATFLWLIYPTPILVILFIILVSLGIIAGILFQAKPLKDGLIVAGNEVLGIFLMISVIAAFRFL